MSWGTVSSTLDNALWLSLLYCHPGLTPGVKHSLPQVKCTLIPLHLFQISLSVLIPGKLLTLVSNFSNYISLPMYYIPDYLGQSVSCFFGILLTEFLISCFPFSNTCVSSRYKWSMKLISTLCWSSYGKFYAVHSRHHKNSVSFHSSTWSAFLCPICLLVPQRYSSPCLLFY